MRKIAVIVARFDGEVPRRLPEQTLPARCLVDFYYFDDTAMKFNKELTAQQKEDYIKFNPHKIAGLKEHDVFIWLDKIIKVNGSDFISQVLNSLSRNSFLSNYDKTIFAVQNIASVINKGFEIYKIKAGRPVGLVMEENFNYDIVEIAGYRIIPSPRPIIGFWHICMINNWQDVVKEQLGELVKHGLMDACETIHIGALGPEKEFDALGKLLSRHKKIKFDYHSTDITEYEFPTLNLIKKESAVNEFFGFYFHTKGVSYNGHAGGTHWRHYMNYYNLEKWQECIDRLRAGATVVGAKLLEKSGRNPNPTHFSGNYFHFRSEYAATCPEVETLNTNNRFEAEYWICKGKEMKAVNMCSAFIDYNTQGVFKKPETGRTIVHTLCFNLPAEVQTATDLLRAQNPNNNFEHLIIDLGFPLEKDEIPKDIEKVKRHNSKLLQATAKNSGAEYCKLNNVGVSQNWEAVRRHVKLSDNDVLICADPDERPLHNNWVKAVSEVLMHGNNIGWCSLFYVDHIPILKNYPHTVTYVYGHKIYLMNCLLGWAQGGFSGKFLNEIGGIPYHPKAPIYGWIEDACYEKMKKGGWKWAIVADYQVTHTDTVALYRAWKTQITSHVNDGQMSFEEWIVAQKNKI